MEFNRIQRQALIVWLYTTKQLKQLKKYGNVHYVSRRMKYALIYVNDHEADVLAEALEKLHFVRSVDQSRLGDIDFDFSKALSELDNHGNYLKSLRSQDRSMAEIVSDLKSASDTNEKD